MVRGVFVETNGNVGGVSVFDQVSVLPIQVSDFEQNYESEHDAPIDVDDQSFVTAFQIFFEIIPERLFCLPSA